MLSGALSLQLAMYPFLVDSDEKFSCDSRVRCAPFIHRPLWHKCDTSNCFPLHNIFFLKIGLMS